jgi:hypothetical protein
VTEKTPQLQGQQQIEDAELALVHGRDRPTVGHILLQLMSRSWYYDLKSLHLTSWHDI